MKNMYSRYQNNYGFRQRNSYFTSTNGKHSPAEQLPKPPKNYGGTVFGSNNEAQNSRERNTKDTATKQSDAGKEKYPMPEAGSNSGSSDFTFPRWDISGGSAPKLKFREYESNTIEADPDGKNENVELSKIKLTETDLNKNDISDDIKGENAVIPEIKELFSNINISSSELLLIALIIYLLGSHSDDEMVIILLILLILGFY